MQLFVEPRRKDVTMTFSKLKNIFKVKSHFCRSSPLVVRCPQIITFPHTLALSLENFQEKWTYFFKCLTS